MNQKSRLRLLLTPSPVVWKLLQEIHTLTGRPKAAIVAELLNEIAPVLQEQLDAQKALAKNPERARELIHEYGWRSVETIAQAQLELPPAKKRRSRKNGTP